MVVPKLIRRCVRAALSLAIIIMFSLFKSHDAHARTHNHCCPEFVFVPFPFLYAKMFRLLFHYAEKSLLKSQNKATASQRIFYQII